MDMLWAGIKATAGIVGQAAVETGMKGKLQTELMLINREIETRKRSFGEELYGYVVRSSRNIRSLRCTFAYAPFRCVGTVVEES